MLPTPHASGITAFDGGELHKSFSAMSLNKSRILSGGGSGYRSESRRPITEATKFRVVGSVSPLKVIKTIIYMGGKRLSKLGYVKEAYKLPYVSKVEYISEGGKMAITNTNI